MSKSESLLERAHVATPCSADWERMEGDEKKRLCAQCNLHVYNVKALTRREAETLIARTEGRLCMRIYRRADGTVITSDCPAGLRAVRRRISRAAGATLAAVLSLFSGSAVARTYVSQGQTVNPNYKLKVERSRSKSEEIQPALRGIVLDTNRASIVDARITLIRDGEKAERGEVSSDEGTFRFASLEPGTYTFVVSSPGFITFRQRNLQVKTGEDVSLEVTLEVGSTGGVVIVTQGDVSLNN
jgi:hypothetical protein